jgi:GNAT superfamily N-acetyltransferase
MAVTMMRQEMTVEYDEPREAYSVGELARAHQDEVIEFLSARPIHTVFMTGLIRDNGLLSPQNRGSFYGTRNRFGQLEGVALIGHATIVEAHTESALMSFARLARNCQTTSLIRGEETTTSSFWRYYADAGYEPRLICNEHLFGLSDPPIYAEPVNNLQPATMDDLDRILAVNSAMAFEEGGIRPLQRDPGGFRCRTARRIEQGRIWTWYQKGRLVFKADVVSQTPEVSYLEGIYVHPEERGKGYGLRCLTQLSALLLGRSRSICLTANNRNKAAITFYKKAGYQFYSHYETIYLR